VEFIKADGSVRKLQFNPWDTKEIKGTGTAVKKPSIDDRSSARSFILSHANKPAHKSKKDLLLTLANALQDDIWKVL
jgi:hypothetical protein